MSSQASGATPEEAPQWQPIESVPFRFGSAPSALVGPIPAPLFATPSTSGSILSVNPPSELINRSDSNFSDIAPLGPASQASPSLPASEVGFTQLAEAMSDLSSQPSQEDSLKIPNTQSFSTSPSDAHQQLQREDTEFIAPLPLNTANQDPFAGLESEQEAEEEVPASARSSESETSPNDDEEASTPSKPSKMDETKPEEPASLPNADPLEETTSLIATAPEPSIATTVEQSAPVESQVASQTASLPSENMESDSSDDESDDIFPANYKAHANVDLPSANLPSTSGPADDSSSDSSSSDEKESSDSDEASSSADASSDSNQEASSSEESSDSNDEDSSSSDDRMDNVPSTSAMDVDVAEPQADVDTSTHTEDFGEASPPAPPTSAVKRAKSTIQKPKRSSDAYVPISSTGEGVSITDKSPLKPFTLPPFRRMPGATRAQAIDLDDEVSVEAKAAPKAKKRRGRPPASRSRMDTDDNEEEKKTIAGRMKRRSSTSSLSSQKSDLKPSEPAKAKEPSQPKEPEDPTDEHAEPADSISRVNKKRAASYEALEFDDDSIDSQELAEALPGISSLLRRVTKQPAGSKPPPKPAVIAPPAKKPKLAEVSDEHTPAPTRPKQTSSAKSTAASTTSPKATASKASADTTAPPKSSTAKLSSASKASTVASHPAAKPTAKASTSSPAASKKSAASRAPKLAPNSDSESDDSSSESTPSMQMRRKRNAADTAKASAASASSVASPPASKRSSTAKSAASTRPTRSAKQELIDEAPAEPEQLSPAPKRLTRKASSVAAPVETAAPVELPKTRRKPPAKEIETAEEPSPVTSPASRKRTAAKKAAANSSKASSSRPPVIMSSGLTANSRKYLAFLTDELGGKLENSFTDEVTHLVVSVDKQGTPNRTLKYLEGLVRGVDIVTVTWAMESLEQKKFLPVDQWLVKGSSDTEDRAKLFSKYHFILYGDYNDEKHLKLAEVEKLLRLAGAKFEHLKNASAREVASAFEEVSSRTPMVICDHFVDINKAMAISMATDESPVKVDWLIDSIHQGRLLDSNNYTMVVTISDDLDESITY